jgi:acyl-CoA thioester hydrolase
VNNVVYARWIETGRIAYFRRIGLMERMRTEGIGPILGRIEIDYRRPVTFPDSVRVDVCAASIGKRSFTMAYRLWSTGQQAEVASGEDVIVLFDYRGGRAVPVDDALRSAIAEVEGAVPRPRRPGATPS